jgi:glycosyltransferase involved in cell wall biosynthesis
VIRHNLDGLLVPCGDVAGLAASMRRLAEDGALRRRLGEAGRARQGIDFRWHDKLRLVRDTYSALKNIPK